MKFSERCWDILKGDGVGIMPTDTIYGVVGSAMNKDTVDRIYTIRHRDRRKPMIVLISSSDECRKFGMKLGSEDLEALSKVWPGKVSVILPCINPEFEYLSCGTSSIAFRVPYDEDLRELLLATGPVVAPSANLEGKEPATTIVKAEEYFGSDVDFYEDGGKIENTPSTLVLLDRGKFRVVRQGAERLSKDLVLY